MPIKSTTYILKKNYLFNTIETPLKLDSSGFSAKLKTASKILKSIKNNLFFSK